MRTPLEALRRIVDTQQAAEVDGHLVDLFSASIIVGVAGTLSDEQAEKFGQLPIPLMLDLALCLGEKAERKEAKQRVAIQ